MPLAYASQVQGFSDKVRLHVCIMFDFTTNKYFSHNASRVCFTFQYHKKKFDAKKKKQGKLRR